MHVRKTVTPATEQRTRNQSALHHQQAQAVTSEWWLPMMIIINDERSVKSARRKNDFESPATDHCCSVQGTFFLKSSFKDPLREDSERKPEK